MPLDSDDGDDDLFAPSNGASSLLALLDDAVTATSAPIDVSALVKAEPEHLDFVGRGIGDAGLSELATALSDAGTHTTIPSCHPSPCKQCWGR